MLLRQIANSYFTAIPADIVQCVDTVLPVPVRGNRFEVQDVITREDEMVTAIAHTCSGEYIWSYAGGVWINNIDILRTPDFCCNVFVDRNDVPLLHICTQEIVVGVTLTKLSLPCEFNVCALALLSNDVCVVGSYTHFVCVNYVTNTIVPGKLFEFARSQPLALYDMVGFNYNNNIAMSYKALSQVVLLSCDTGDILRAQPISVNYWAVDHTDQLIVLQKGIRQYFLHIFSPMLEAVFLWCPFVWMGNFIVDRQGRMHIAESEKPQIVVVKTF
jgi:hypothetical protein